VIVKPKHVVRTGKHWPGHAQSDHPDQEVASTPFVDFLTPSSTSTTSSHIMADTLNFNSSPRPSTPNNNQNNPLTVIIRRLEAATSRLEDIASTSTTFETLENGKLAQGNAPRASAANLPGTAVLGSPAVEAPKPTALELPPAIKEMDELIGSEVKTFVEASKGIDTLVEGQVGGMYMDMTV
jgi:hypothetical protein